MKFIATTSSKMNSIPVVSGQMIFSRDDRVIYLDAESARTSFQSIITIVDEETRQSLTSPVEGFYFVEETVILWRYSNSTWTQITKVEDEDIVFANNAGMPATGKDKVLYVNSDDDTIYRWDATKSSYIAMDQTKWDSIA